MLEKILELHYSSEWKCWLLTKYDHTINQIGDSETFHYKKEGVTEALKQFDNNKDIIGLKIYTKNFGLQLVKNKKI